MEKTKLLFCVLDGAADRPCKDLGGKTPFEAAEKPAIDGLTQKGATGIVEVIPGVAPESDAAVLSLLGYDPEKHHVGRGVFEALGAGLEFKNGMLALRANFATTSNGRDIVDRRAGRNLSTEEAKLLEKALNEIKIPGFKCTFRATVQHRGVLVIEREGGALSSNISNTDPAYAVGKGKIGIAKATFKPEVVDAEPLDESKEAMLAAEAVNKWWNAAFSAIDEHEVNKARRNKGFMPGNLILLRDAGSRLPRLKPLPGKWAIVADMPLEIGIAKAARMDVEKVPVPTFTSKDYASRVEAAVKCLKNHDGVYVHLKGPDLFGHDGMAKEKTRSIEDIDEAFFQPLLKRISLKETIVAVTCDHTTPCDLKAHSSDPVPLAVAGGTVESDATQEFNEKACAKGAFGTLRGPRVMPMLLKLAGLQ
jgi:2,3-bisphosphoglycerate-independent phosphoglycerate mutase